MCVHSSRDGADLDAARLVFRFMVCAILVGIPVATGLVAMFEEKLDLHNNIFDMSTLSSTTKA